MSGLFSKPKAPTIITPPAPVLPKPLPAASTVSAEEKAKLEGAAKKEAPASKEALETSAEKQTTLEKARKKKRPTILTSKRGILTPPNVGRKTLLGG